MDDIEGWVTIKQACEFLELSDKAVYNAITRRDLTRNEQGLIPVAQLESYNVRVRGRAGRSKATHFWTEACDENPDIDMIVVLTPPDFELLPRPWDDHEFMEAYDNDWITRIRQGDIFLMVPQTHVARKFIRYWFCSQPKREYVSKRMGISLGFTLPRQLLDTYKSLFEQHNISFKIVDTKVEALPAL
jgi:hypothetical protein